MVAERAGRVLVGARELSLLSWRTTTLDMPKCNDPNTQCNEHPELQEPYLRGLTSGRTIRPWRKFFVRVSGCDKGVDVTVNGAVGTVVFSAIWTWEMACGGGCPMHNGAFLNFDVDTGAPVELEFPRDVVTVLRERAKKQAPGEAGAACGAFPPYRAFAAYNSVGELDGVYTFGTDNAGLCAGAPTCPNPEERAPWLPRRLGRWGKLPAWLAPYLVSSKAQFAFPIPQARVATVQAELARQVDPPAHE